MKKKNKIKSREETFVISLSIVIVIVVIIFVWSVIIDKKDTKELTPIQQAQLNAFEAGHNYGYHYGNLNKSQHWFNSFCESAKGMEFWKNYCDDFFYTKLMVAQATQDYVLCLEGTVPDKYKPYVDFFYSDFNDFWDYLQNSSLWNKGERYENDVILKRINNTDCMGVILNFKRPYLKSLSDDDKFDIFKENSDLTISNNRLVDCDKVKISALNSTVDISNNIFECHNNTIELTFYNSDVYLFGNKIMEHISISDSKELAIMNKIISGSFTGEMVVNNVVNLLLSDNKIEGFKPLKIDGDVNATNILEINETINKTAYINESGVYVNPSFACDLAYCDDEGKECSWICVDDAQQDCIIECD